MESQTEAVHVEPGSGILVRYEPGRGRRQMIGLVIMMAIMLGVLVFGAWVILTFLRELTGAALVICLSVGGFLELLGLLCCISGIVGLRRIDRQRRQTEPLLTIDHQGISGLTRQGAHGADARPMIAWSEVVAIHVRTVGQQVRPVPGPAALDADARVRQETRRVLDRGARQWFSLRDGKRRILVDLADDDRAGIDLTFPLSPEPFARLTREVETFVSEHHGAIPIDGDVGS